MRCSNQWVAGPFPGPSPFVPCFAPDGPIHPIPSLDPRGPSPLNKADPRPRLPARAGDVVKERQGIRLLIGCHRGGGWVLVSGEWLARLGSLAVRQAERTARMEMLLLNSPASTCWVLDSQFLSWCCHANILRPGDPHAAPHRHRFTRRDLGYVCSLQVPFSQSATRPPLLARSDFSHGPDTGANRAARRSLHWGGSDAPERRIRFSIQSLPRPRATVDEASRKCLSNGTSMGTSGIQICLMACMV